MLEVAHEGRASAVEGLQVLQVAETRRGLRVRAGVQYTNPPPGREVFDKAITTAPTQGEVDLTGCFPRSADRG